MHLKLFKVKDFDRWGYSDNLVWAKDREQAKELAGCADSKHCEAQQLEVSYTPKLIWAYDYSPDSC